MRSRVMSLTFLLVGLAFPATASANFAHTVSPGESLASVAAADGLSVAQLAAANGLSSDGYLQAGSVLQIPPQDAGVSAAPATTEAVATSSAPASEESSEGESASSGGGYVVQPGQTLSGIAAANGLSVSELAAENGLDPNAFLIAGTPIRIGGSSASAATAQPVSTASSTPVSTASSAPAGGASTAGGGGMASASDVGQIAAAEGVSPSLAEAIGYQESGFNNGEVSSTGAQGVMQLEPGTVSYINRFLGGSVSPYSVTDNIRGGVLFLHSLLNQTGGDPALAAAAYYQGLASVREHGVLPSTQQYVNNVLALRARFGGG